MTLAERSRQFVAADILFHLFFLSAISPLHNFGLPVEHFPYGIFCIFFAKKVREDVFFLTVGLIFFYCASMIYYSNYNIKVITYLVATVNIMSFLWFVPGNEDRLIRAARNVFWVSIGVGFMQFFGLLSSLETFMQFFIQRFSGARIGELRGTYRGVTLLETEPARASAKIILLYIIAFHSYRTPLSKYFVIAIFAQLVLIKSATGIFLSLVAVFLVSMRYRQAQVAMLIVLAVAGPFLLSFLMENPKFAVILRLYEVEGLPGIYKGFVATSGGRALAVVNTFQAAISNPLGHGADPDFFTFEFREEHERLIAGYRTYVASRPTSMFLNFVYVYGWVPFFMLLWLTVRSTPTKHTTFGDPVFWIIMFCGFLYSAAATPMVLVAWWLYSYRSAEEDEASVGSLPPNAPRNAAGFDIQARGVG